MSNPQNVEALFDALLSVEPGINEAVARRIAESLASRSVLVPSALAEDAVPLQAREKHHAVLIAALERAARGEPPPTWEEAQAISNDAVDRDDRALGLDG